MAIGDEIQDRMVRFGVAVLSQVESFPKTHAARHVAEQLTRSATSAAPNYAEARGAESRKDFVHKLRIVLKELNETQVWLQMAQMRQMIRSNGAPDLLKECTELSKIVMKSVQTAEGRGRASDG
jgi:four helix bundle protein